MDIHKQKQFKIGVEVF